MSTALSSHTEHIKTRLAAFGIPLARLLEAARIDRSTWSRWRSGSTVPRLDRWIAVTKAFDALVAEATPAPAAVEPEAAGAEPITLTGSSAPTGTPPGFVPIATAAPAGSASAPAVDATSSDVEALIAGVLPPGDVVSQSDRASPLIERARQAWGALCDRPQSDPAFEQARRLNDAIDLACGNLAASPAQTPRELAAKASVILTGVGNKPAGWEHEVVPLVDLVQSMAVDAVRLGQAVDTPRTSFRADLAALAELTAENDRLAVLAWECHERTSWPSVPDALFCRPVDGPFFLGVAARRHDGPSWYNVSAVERLRTQPFEGAFIDPSGRDRRRRDEIVAAYDGWQADRAAASEASGLAALGAESQACGSMMRELRDVILDRPARTLDDVLAKAAVFGWWYVDEGERASTTMAADRTRMLAKGEGTLPLAMALGILGDLVTMAEARGLTISAAPEPAGAGVIEPPIAAQADFDALVAEWVLTSVQDRQDDETLQDALRAPTADAELKRMRGNAARQADVLWRIADLRSTSPHVLALKAAAVLTDCREAAELDADIARRDGSSLGEGEIAVALSLVRDVIAMHGEPVRRLVAAVAAAAEAPIAGDAASGTARAAA